MKDTKFSPKGITGLAAHSRRLRAQWDEKRAELKPDQATLRSWRQGVEWERKGIHLSATVFAVWTFYVQEPLATLVLAVTTLFGLTVDFYRVRSRRWALWFYKALPFVFRVDERRTFTGASILMVGITLTSALFPAVPATAGILCLIWGDSAAALVGQYFQQRRRLRQRPGTQARAAVRARRQKTLAGTLGCWFVSMFMVFLCVGPWPAVIIIGGLTAALLERWTPGQWDNLTIPLATAGIVKLGLTWWPS